MHRTWLAALYCHMALGVICGCSPAPSGDDGRLEHQIPPHKPATFTAAIDEVERRLLALSAATEPAENAEPPRDRARDRAELQDIVHWLPELAADSDLRKVDWNTVQSLSGELSSLIDSQQAGDRGSSDRLPQAFRKIVEQLRAIAGRLDQTQVAAGRPATDIHDEQSNSSAPGDARER